MSAKCFNETEAEERARLDEVIGKIATELSTYSMKVDSRRSERRELVTDLQENKADMDHVEKASMRQSVNLMTLISEHGVEQQRRLSRLVDSPYFGRIDIDRASDQGIEPIYVGIHSFYDPHAEEQLVHDWRAPVSSMFYEYELGDASYESPAGQVACEIVRKRQYRIERQELVFMLETSLNIQDDILQKELSRASDDKMKNIVATIQRDQNAIIRNDESHSLIIQGAAGSGKTSIALHRIAFLLYKYKDTIRSDDILIISPNKVFAHYISQVLPELGEDMIQETTMEELASRLLGHQVKYQTFAEQVSRLLRGGDEKYAERIRFKATAEFLKQLDAYANHVRRTNLNTTDIKVGLYTLKADWLSGRFAHYQNMPVNDQVSRVLADIVAYMQAEHEKDVPGKERATLRTQLKRMFVCTTLNAIYKNFYAWMGKPEMFRQLKGGVYEYSDVFPLAYLKRLLEGAFTTSRIKHVVIDEMQDYTPIQYQVIASLYPCKKTILGDHNQSVSPLNSSSAEAIRDILHEADCMYMHKSYRSTIEITEVAQSIHRNPNLMPIERHGETPTIVACADAEQEVRHIREAIRRFMHRSSIHSGSSARRRSRPTGSMRRSGWMVRMSTCWTRAAPPSATAS